MTAKTSRAPSLPRVLLAVQPTDPASPPLVCWPDSLHRESHMRASVGEKNCDIRSDWPRALLSHLGAAGALDLWPQPPLCDGECQRSVPSRLRWHDVIIHRSRAWQRAREVPRSTGRMD